MISARYFHTATLLPAGQILVAGGNGPAGALASTEIYDPASNTWMAGPSMTTSRAQHSAVVLPFGRVLLLNGHTGGSSDLYESFDGAWSVTGAMYTPRSAFTLTLLPSGNVLAVGGNDAAGTFLNTCEVYSPTSGLWTAAASMAHARAQHTATLLANGNVLVAAGNTATNNNSISSAEIYCPSNDTWTSVSGLLTARAYHTATLLLNAKVLVGGGIQGQQRLSSAEAYDPSSDTWTAYPNLTSSRDLHFAALLPGGKAMLVDGITTFSTTADIYDPLLRTWTSSTEPGGAVWYQSGVLLPGPTVVACGGEDNFSFSLQQTAAAYAPVNGNLFWNSLPSMTMPRVFHAMIGTPDSKAMAIGGYSRGSVVTNSCEAFHLLSRKWFTLPSLNSPREGTAAALLADGSILVAGGFVPGAATATAEIYKSAFMTNSMVRPQIASISSSIFPGGIITVTGSGFTGISEGSGGDGFQCCAANFPMLQLRNIETTQTIFLGCTNWSDTNFISVPLTNFPPGPAIATIYVNGAPSTNVVVTVSPAPSTPPLLTNMSVSANQFSFNFTNAPGSLFCVLATTNLALPLTNWTAVSGLVESPPGTFTFTNAVSTQRCDHMYSVESQ
jgi:hypothetical protein